MSWFSSLVIGLLTGVAGCFGAAVLGSLCARWYRIPSFEGASGYYVLGFAFAGAVGGLIGGIVCSRFITPGDREFLRGLGVAVGGLGGLLAAIAFVCWLAADLPPKLDGRELELEVEIRCPARFTMPFARDSYDPFVSIEPGRRSPVGKLRLDAARQENGRWIVPAVVPLQTSSSRKFLRAYFNQDYDALAPLPLRRHPQRQDLAWSGWVEAGWNARQPEPPPEQKFAIRYRVVPVEPPPSQPTLKEIEAQEAAAEQAKFDAIPAGAPVAVWLPYTRYGLHEERQRAAVRNLAAPPDHVEQLAALMVAPDPQVASDALHVVAHLPQPSPGLVPAVTAAGRHIIGLLQKANVTPPEADPSYAGAADIAVRFNGWMSAVRALREKSGGDFTAELAEILQLSRVREDSYVLQMDVRRVASYYLHQWAGVAPLAGDPKPR